MPQTTHITTSGGLISTAFIENIRQARTNQRGTQLDTFGLPWQEAPPTPTALEQAVAETWEALLERWDAIATELPRMDISQVRDRWVLPLLRALDFQPVYQRSDIVLDDSEALRFNISHFGWESKKDERGRETNDERGMMNDAEKIHPSSFIIHHYPAPPIHIVSPSAGLDARPAGATNSRSAKGKSPHDMVQLFLNVSREHRWGVVSNGQSLRLLRDYHHTYTKGYVEFDLESIFETRNFADFRALYRLTQASRFMGEAVEPADDAATEPADRWDSVPLEMFYRDSQAAGIQVGADLQKQVREAIETLGNGFLASSFQLAAGNREEAGGSSENDPNSPLATPHSLLQALQQDPALCQQFYAELLHIVYRVLFLLYAEQRGMAPGSGAPLDTLYRQSYSLTALRSKAESDPASPEAYDLWEGLKVTFKMFRQGAPDLGVYRYNGMLFAEDQTPILEGSREWGMGNRAKDPTPHSLLPTPPAPLRCRNYELLRAIRALTLVEREGVLQRISYVDLNVEEIGGIYESLLDFAPRVTTQAETVEGRELPANTFFLDPRGTARKTTGSYYTHPSLVNALIESALIPVLEQRVEAAINRPLPGDAASRPTGPRADAQASYEALIEEQRRDAEAAILSLKVCDPAMGSGHFLIAANNALALRLAQIRSGDDYPAERELRRARRDVLAHCLYGVDLNPMAVELCKVALWINAAVDDAPLSFLDHHLKCGNSLIGATPELLKNGIPDDAFQPVTGDDPKVAAAVRKRNKKEREGQLSLWRVTVLESEADVQQWRDLNELAENQPHIAEQRYEAYRAGPGYRNAKLIADLWTAAFFWPLDEDTDLIPTEELFRQAQADSALVPERIKAQAAQLAEHHKFFHWHQEFPDVFQAGDEGGTMNDEAKDSSFIVHHSGFDVVLGNPPWERIKLQEKEFFSDKDPAIANAANAAARRRAIAALQKNNYALWHDYTAALRDADSQSHFLRHSGRYPLTGRGDVNTYQVFAELARELPGSRGRAGVIVPTGIATDYTNRDFFADLVDSGQLASLFDFENRRGIFPGVHRSYKFSLLTLRGPVADPAAAPADFAFFLLDTDDRGDPEKTFSLTAADFARLNPNTKTCPIFRSRTDAELTRKLYAAAPVLHNEETGQNPWSVSFLRMFDMTNDSGLFRTREQLQAEGFTLYSNRFVRNNEVYLPLYEAKMFHQFNHRFATFELDETARDLTLNELYNPNLTSLSRYWIPAKEAETRLKYNSTYLLSFRNVARATDERTGIFTIIPFCGVGNSAPIFLLDTSGTKIGGLTANLASIPFDFSIRQKVGGINFNFFIVEQLPVIPPDRYTPDLLAFIVPRVLELTYTAWDLRAFADDVWREAKDERGREAKDERGRETNDERGTMNDESVHHSSFIIHHSIAHHSSLQDAILRQWEANRDATNGGHEGATPPAWAEANDERGRMKDEGEAKDEGGRMKDESKDSSLIAHHSSLANITHRSRFPRPPFKWDEIRRAQLRADLDGLYGHLYGLTREELAYILDTFPIVRRKDEARYGEYRTKRMVLEAYDELQRGMMNDE